MSQSEQLRNESSPSVSSGTHFYNRHRPRRSSVQEQYRDSIPDAPRAFSLGFNSLHDAKKSPLGSQQQQDRLRNDERLPHQSSQSRRLQLRNARFRGTAVASSPATHSSIPVPVSHSARARRQSQRYASLDGHLSDGDEDEPDHSSSPLLSSPLQDGADMHSRTGDVTDPRDFSVLQEISNLSLRRKRRGTSKALDTQKLHEKRLSENRKDINSIVRPWNADEAPYSPSSPEQSRFATSDISPESIHGASTKIGGRIRKTLVRAAKSSSTVQRTVSGGTSRYIEHLESQLATAQTQLQTLNSSTSSTGNAAKIRSINGENKLLREELADWEAKFEQRVLEQAEHHDDTVAGLNSQIRGLEKEKETSELRVKELELEIEEKAKQLQAIEGANYDLERRLDFMSELIATSPTRDRPFQHQEYFESAPAAGSATTTRPRSTLGFQRLSLVTSGQVIPRSGTALSPDRDAATSTGSPSYAERRPTSSADPFGQLAFGNDKFAYATVESGSEMSEGTTLIEQTGSTPGTMSRRDSLTQYHTTDDEMKKKHPRRMRRFYTGSKGPKSLILPATACSGSFPVSAPVSIAPTPALPLRSPFNASRHARFGSRDLHRRSQSILHRRSATWDNDDLSTNARKMSLAEHDENSYTLISPTAYPVDEAPERDDPAIENMLNMTKTVTPEKSAPLEVMNSAQAFSSPAAGLNLFEELRGLEVANDQSSNSSASDGRGHCSQVSRSSLGGSRPVTAVHQEHISDLHTRLGEEGTNEVSYGDKTKDPMSVSISSVATAKQIEKANLPSLDHREVAVQDTKKSSMSLTAYDQRRRLVFPHHYSPGSLITHMLGLMSHSLNSHHPMASRVVTNAWSWSLGSLCWPIVEFRWWLVKLLLGGIWKRRNDENPGGDGRRSHFSRLRELLLSGKCPSPGMIVLMPGTIRKLGLMTIFEQEATACNDGGKSQRHQRTTSIASEDEYDLFVEGTESTEQASSTHRLDVQSVSVSQYSGDKFNVEDDNDDDNDDDDEVVDETQGEHENEDEKKNHPRTDNEKPIAPPITWLKFSLTLCFAIGIAIKDGPASLFITKT